MVSKLFFCERETTRYGLNEDLNTFLSMISFFGNALFRKKSILKFSTNPEHFNDWYRVEWITRCGINTSPSAKPKSAAALKNLQIPFPRILASILSLYFKSAGSEFPLRCT